MRKLTTTQFVERSHRVHGTKYDYSLVTYVSSSTPVKIACKIHGVFNQRPNDHTLKKQGCPKCGKFNMAEKVRKKNQDFVIEANKVHGNKYSYERTKYVNTHTPVIITCLKHGDFEQRPNVHLSQLCGCLKCGYEGHPGKYSEQYFSVKGRKNISGIFYILKFEYKDECFIKAGITRTGIKSRFVGKHKPYTIETLLELKTTLWKAFKIEQRIKNDFKNMQYTPKYSFDGYTECLLLCCYDNLICSFQLETQSFQS